MEDPEVDATLSAVRARRGPARRGRRATVLALAPLLVVVLLAAATLLAGSARAANYPPLSGSISGPSDLGMSLKGTYRVQATGGPAIAPNGTQVGVFSYKAYLTGANTTGAFVTPISGVLVNRSVNVTVSAPNVTEGLTLYVLVTSGYQSTNTSDNLSYAIEVVEPYRVSATLLVGSQGTLAPSSLTVTLDGVVVGSISVPTLSAGASYPVSFSYVTSGLSVGWHTFTISLGALHGLVTFAGGAGSYSASFYVPGPPTDYSVWYFAGAAAFVGAIFIWATRVGARRRGRGKK